MHEHVSVMTEGGEVTIPSAIRQVLGLAPGDRVAFVPEDGHVRLERVLSVTERTAGIAKSDMPPLTAEELREVAERVIAEASVQ